MRRNGRPMFSRIADHYNGVPNSNFGMHDRAVGHIIASQLPSAECLLEKVDDRLSPCGNEVRRDCRVALWFVRGCHICVSEKVAWLAPNEKEISHGRVSWQTH